MDNTRPPKIIDQTKEDCVLALGNKTLMLKEIFFQCKGVLLPEGLKALNQSLISNQTGAFTTDAALYQDSYLGVQCQILEPGKSWSKGKIRMKVVFEFYPDEPDEEAQPLSPESPLDDIRKSIN